jgi:hypothetical protein
MAASNRRDLVLEVAFHAAHHSRHGPAVMDWLARRLALPKFGDRWCAYQLARMPVDEWLDRCERELSPIVSGQVFATGAGKRVEWIMPEVASQLGEACVYLDVVE